MTNSKYNYVVYWYDPKLNKALFEGVETAAEALQVYNREVINNIDLPGAVSICPKDLAKLNELKRHCQV
jgi:hypothetical protein